MEKSKIQNLKSKITLGAVLIASAGFSAFYLVNYVGTIGLPHGVVPEWFAASVMVASGKGFVAPQYPPAPVLSDFFEQKTLKLDKADLANIKTDVPWHFHRRYRWLFYAVGLTWRIFGISWETMKILCVVAFAATIGIVYGIFRLGMNRAWSALGALTYMVSPLMIAALPSIRDFCKAPFILGSVLLIGHLLLGESSRKRLYFLSAGLGALIGFGMGFRDDIQICLLPALVAILAARTKTTKQEISSFPNFHLGTRLPWKLRFERGSRFFIAFSKRSFSDTSVPKWKFGNEERRTRLGLWIRERMKPVVLMLVCFLIPAAPILKSMHDIGSLSYHHLIEGLATESNHYLGMGAASYELMALRNDNLGHALRNSYSRRVIDPNKPVGFEDPDSALAGKQFLWAVAKTFPADLITRAYAAVLYHLGDVPQPLIVTSGPEDAVKKKLIEWEMPVATHFQRYGVFYAIAALAIIAMRDFRLGLAALLLVLYFCGYTSLQFHPRHCFHLAFVPFWFLFFLADKAVANLPRSQISIWERIRTRNSVSSDPQSTASETSPFPNGNLGTRNPTTWWAPAKRVAALSGLTAAGLLIPLGLARVYQVHAVETAIVRKCEAAQLEPLAVAIEPGNGNGWVKYSLTSPLPELPFIEKATNSQQWDVHTEYLAVDLAATQPTVRMQIHYDPPDNSTGFSSIVDIGPTGADPNKTTRYFFPVYEFPKYAFVGCSHFLGISFPPADAAGFKGLYRVTNLDTFTLLPHVSLPADKGLFKCCQTIRP